ncbi:hypothetical protein B484DRAFT_407373 [Ochromonadaceae sp. CCMP2298]|nr:hypothetical protein B484DRAFT_407373 [Ochromonadaceae sp. CCMP2298]
MLSQGRSPEHPSASRAGERDSAARGLPSGVVSAREASEQDAQPPAPHHQGSHASHSPTIRQQEASQQDAQDGEHGGYGQPPASHQQGGRTMHSSSPSPHGQPAAQDRGQGGYHSPLAPHQLSQHQYPSHPAPHLRQRTALLEGDGGRGAQDRGDGGIYPHIHHPLNPRQHPDQPAVQHLHGVGEQRQDGGVGAQDGGQGGYHSPLVPHQLSPVPGPLWQDGEREDLDRARGRRKQGSEQGGHTHTLIPHQHPLAPTTQHQHNAGERSTEPAVHHLHGANEHASASGACHCRDIELQVREDTIAQLHGRVARRDAEIDELYGRVARRDVQVQVREYDIESLFRRVGRLQARIREQDSQQLSAVQHAGAEDALATASRWLLEKDAEIVRLRAQVEGLLENQVQLNIHALERIEAPHIEAPAPHTSTQDAELQCLQLELAGVRLALTAAERTAASSRIYIADQDAQIAQLQEEKAVLQLALDAESDSSDSSVSGEDEDAGVSKLDVAALQEALADVAAEQGDLQRALAVAVRRNTLHNSGDSRDSTQTQQQQQQ